VRRLAARSLRVVLCAVIVAVVAWSLAAIWIDGPKNRPLAAALCVAVVVGSLLPLVMVRRWWWGGAAAIVPFAIVLAGWLSIAPSNTRNCQLDVAQLPSAVIEGNLVTIRNVRNFSYPSPSGVVERATSRRAPGRPTIGRISPRSYAKVCPTVPSHHPADDTHGCARASLTCDQGPISAGALPA